MKKTVLFSIVSTTLWLFISTASFGQCRDFIGDEVLPLLGRDYVHDGHYNATTLEEGEEADLFKTFFAGQQYRIIVKGSSEFPHVLFKVSDLTGKVLFNNKDADYVDYWDVDVKSSQKLIISIEVPEFTAESDDDKSGCVALVIGMLD